MVECVTTSDNRLIVVRAWHDSDRLLIRVLVSAGPRAPAVESVFSDIESATDRLAEVLGELLWPPAPQVPAQGPAGRIRSVDATSAPADPS
jgi:hypothetical protein